MNKQFLLVAITLAISLIAAPMVLGDSKSKVGTPIPIDGAGAQAVNQILTKDEDFCLSCLKAESPIIWKWHLRNLDQEQRAIMRSPDNPESMVEYMLRTF